MWYDGMHSKCTCISDAKRGGGHSGIPYMGKKSLLLLTLPLLKNLYMFCAYHFQFMIVFLMVTCSKGVSFSSQIDMGSHNPPTSRSSVLAGTRSLLQSMWDSPIHSHLGSSVLIGTLPRVHSHLELSLLVVLSLSVCL